MAKVLLISCNTTEEPYPVYPLGISMLADFVSARGHSILVWDVLAGDGSLNKAAEFTGEHKPDIIGISLRNVDDVNYNSQKSYIREYRELVEKLRRVTSVPIILGGSAYSLFPELMLEEIRADYGVVGEGEKSFCDLIEKIEKGQPPQEKIIRSQLLIQGEKFAGRTRFKDLAEYYLHSGGMLNVQSKRGCPHNCVYCSYPLLEGKEYRFRPSSDVVDEIQLLVEKYNADYFSITDSVFNDASGNYLEIAAELVRRNINIPWMAFFRPGNFRRQEVELLKRSGLSSVEWGTDCSTDITLNAMQKGFHWDEVVESNNLFESIGISNAHFIIFGGPGETEETIDMGLTNITQLENCVIFVSIGIRIFPNTQIHKIALEENSISGDQNLLEPVYYFSHGVNPENLHNKILNSFEGRKDRIYPDGQQIERIRAFHQLGYRGPVWDFILKKK